MKCLLYFETNCVIITANDKIYTVNPMKNAESIPPSAFENAV